MSEKRTIILPPPKRFTRNSHLADTLKEGEFSKVKTYQQAQSLYKIIRRRGFVSAIRFTGEEYLVYKLPKEFKKAW